MCVVSVFENLKKFDIINVYMENSFNAIIESLEKYFKTSFEIVKLKSVEKTSDLFSTLIFRFILSIIATLSALILSIGCAYWLGDIFGKIYYGFIVVGTLWGVTFFFLLLTNTILKRKINDFIIKQLLS